MTTPIGTLTSVNSENVISFTRSYAVSPERLWEAIATADGLSAWLAEGSLEGRTGGSVHLSFDGDQTVTGEVLVWEPYSQLTHTWNINNEVPSTITYRIEPTESGSTMTLTHIKLPDEMAGGYTPGWHAFLDRLDQALAGTPVESWDDLFASAMPLYMPAED